MFTEDGADALARPIFSDTLVPRFTLVCVENPATLSLKFDRIQPSEPAPEQSFSWMTGMSLGHWSCWASAGVTPSTLKDNAAIAPTRRARKALRKVLTGLATGAPGAVVHGGRVKKGPNDGP